MERLVEQCIGVLTRRLRVLSDPDHVASVLAWI